MKKNPPESWYVAKKGYKNRLWTSIRMNDLRKAFYEAKAKAAAAAQAKADAAAQAKADAAAAQAKADADAAAAAELLKNISETDNGDYLAAEAKAAAYIDYLNENDDDELLEIVEPGNEGNEGNGNELLEIVETGNQINDIDITYGVPVSGLNLIKEFEGFRSKAYVDPLSGGLPITIGWGSTVKKDGSHFVLGDVITKKEADELLAYQCSEKYIPSLRKIPYWNEMSDGKKGALLSFAYNLGAHFYGSSNFATITRVLKNKEWDKVPDALYLYRNPGSRVEAGLAKRRIAEGLAWKT